MKALCRPQLYHNHISRRHTTSTFTHTDNTWRNENTKEVSLEPEVSNLRVTFDYRSTEGYRILKRGVYYGAICSKNMQLFYKNFEIFPNEGSTTEFKNTYKLYYVTTSQKRYAFLKKGTFASCLHFSRDTGWLSEKRDNPVKNGTLVTLPEMHTYVYTCYRVIKIMFCCNAWHNCPTYYRVSELSREQPNISQEWADRE